MTVRDLFENILAEPFTKFHHAFLVAGWAGLFRFEVKHYGIASFILARHTGMDRAKIINEFVSLRRAEKRVANEFALTVSAIAKNTGISTAAMRNILSLLMLPPKIRDAVKTGAIPVSQGYIPASV